jgi:hypothetical protein
MPRLIHLGWVDFETTSPLVKHPNLLPQKARGLRERENSNAILWTPLVTPVVSQDILGASNPGPLLHEGEFGKMKSQVRSSFICSF